MNKTLNASLVGSLMLTLAGCMTGGTATDFATANAAFRGVTQANEPPSAADYALSCTEVSARIANLDARYREIEAEQRAAQRRQGLINGGIDALVTVAGGSAMANAGSARAIGNVATATTLSRGALVGIAGQESSATQLRAVNDATLIATRMAQLQRVAFENGC